MSIEKQSFIAYWTEVERGFAATRALAPKGDADHMIYRQTILEKNAKAAEALLIHGGVSPLFQVRALLFRGRLQEADELLRSQNIEKGELTEFILEHTRLHSFNGRWRDALDASDEALRLQPVPVSRLALHQIRALAYLELGELAASRREIEFADSLGEMYPHAPATLYARVLSARVLAREAGALTGQGALKALFESHVQAETLDADKLVSLLRAQADLLCLEGAQHFQFALAAKLISDSSGDRLYSALGMLDMYAAAGPEAKAALLPRLRMVAPEFARVGGWLGQLLGESEGEISGSVRAMRAFTVPEGKQSLQKSWLEGKVFNSLVFPEQQLFVRLQPFSIKRAKGQFQLFQALRLLQQGPIEKERFFRLIWGDQKFAPHLHDPLISRLLYRMRKALGVDAGLRGGVVQLQEEAIILCF